MRFLLALLLAGELLAACDNKVRSLSGNFTVDLVGDQDTRPGTWGTAGAYTSTLTFRPPEGCRIEILEIRGDFLGWPVQPILEQRQAGILLSIARTGPEGSRWADWAEDKCLLYRQAVVTREPARLAFNDRIAEGLLETDHKLEFKMAVWLNNTGVAIHMETSWTIHYRFTSATQAPTT